MSSAVWLRSSSWANSQAEGSTDFETRHGRSFVWRQVRGRFPKRNFLKESTCAPHASTASTTLPGRCPGNRFAGRSCTQSRIHWLAHSRLTDFCWYRFIRAECWMERLRAQSQIVWNQNLFPTTSSIHVTCKPRLHRKHLSLTAAQPGRCIDLQFRRREALM